MCDLPLVASTHHPSFVRSLYVIRYPCLFRREKMRTPAFCFVCAFFFVCSHSFCFNAISFEKKSFYYSNTNNTLNQNASAAHVIVDIVICDTTNHTEILHRSTSAKQPQGSRQFQPICILFTAFTTTTLQIS